MITGWGAHHIDSAHWGMGTEYTGPVEIWGSAEFPKKGLWDVHGAVQDRGAVRQRRHDDRQRRFPERHQVHGTEGWIFVSRGNETVTGERSGREAAGHRRRWPRAIRRSSSRSSGPTRSTSYESKDHHGNWLECIRSRRQPIAPVEVAHRSCSACLLHHIAMKTKRKLLLGSDQGALQERRRGERDAVAAAACAVHA